MKIAYVLLLATVYTSHCFAQKPVATPEDVAEKWGRVCCEMVANNGKYLAYVIYKSAHFTKVDKKMLVVQSTLSSWKREIEIDRYEFQFTADSRKVIIKKGGDSLMILWVGSDKVEYVVNVKSFKLPGEGKGKWLAYQLMDKNETFIFRNLETGMRQKISNVKDYFFCENEKGLILKKKYSEIKQELIWIDLIKNLDEQVVWSGREVVDLRFNRDFTKMAFIAKEPLGNKYVNSIWYYKKGENKALKVIDDKSLDLDGLFSITGLRAPAFDKSDNNIVFYFKEEISKTVNPKSVGVDVWSYTDAKLQSQQLKEIDHSNSVKSGCALMHLDDHSIIYLTQNSETIIGNVGAYVLILGEGSGDIMGEWNWNKLARTYVDLVSVNEGARQRLFDDFSKTIFSDNNITLSPDEKYLIYFDPEKQNYFSYNISTRSTQCLTKNIEADWTYYMNQDEPDADYRPISPVVFINNGRDLLIHSRNDLFQIDISGINTPLNLTNNYGRRNDIAFNILLDNANIHDGEQLVLGAFDRNNNNSGFYRITVGKKANPVLLTMQPYLFSGAQEASSRFGDRFPILKAKDANIYIVTRQSASESPNLFFTSDFKRFTPASNYYPERAYNWLTSELHTWKGLDGRLIKGILYKPEDFDASKKYPVIFHYYEKRSHELHIFKRLEYSTGDLNIPYFVSKGYLVFVPDIPKIMGHPGPSAINAVVSAANYLSAKSYVDSSKLGLQGHSFGGFETNYIITHSSKFAAAVSAASMSDFISCYGSIMWLGNGTSRQRQYEIYHDAIGASMWERPDLYIENSPVLYADKVTTPVLMMNNTSDADVPFAQGVEFFTALRRLGKRVWMLQYDGQDHTIFTGGTAQQEKDFTNRMLQFFDHYLKKRPAPIWMTRGIPAKDKGIKDGFKYDIEIKTPIEGGLLIPGEKQKIDAFKNRHPFIINMP